MKKFLKGEKPKLIGEVKDEAVVVTNQDGAKTSVAAGSASQYFNNPHIDNCVIQIFGPLSGDPNRSAFKLIGADGTLNIDKASFKDMASKVVDETTQISKTTHKQIIKADLFVKKPDLIGNSKWGFVLDHNIEAEILDKSFLKKVRDNEFQFGAGSMLPCKMLIEVGLDEKNEPLPAKYSIIEVTGKPFVSDHEDTQKKLFGDHTKD